MKFSTLTGHTDSIHATCFSPDSTLLISGSLDFTVRVWQSSHNGHQWSCISVLYGHTRPIDQLIFLSCGKRFLSRQWDGTIRLWDISALVEGREFEIKDVKEGALVHPGWFGHGICLGGWTVNGPFVMEYPFKLPVEPLKWDVDNFKFPKAKKMKLDGGNVQSQRDQSRLKVAQTEAEHRAECCHIL